MTEQIREQNWFAVALDFLIVVVGVFVGLQVSNWNQEQADKRRGKDYAERLAKDVHLDLRYRGNLLAYYDAVNESAERTVDLLAQPSPDPKTLVVNAYRATEYANHTPTRATWDEVVSSGEISLLPITAVDNGLALYFTGDAAERALQIMVAAPYRKRVRRTIPHKIQLAIRHGCGDIRDDIGNVTGFRKECDLNVSDEELSSAADALLADPDILPDLWLHFSDISSARGDLIGELALLEHIERVLKGDETDLSAEAEQ